MRANRDERGVKAALAAFGVEIGDHVVAGETDTQRSDPLELSAEYVAGHPVGRDAVAHHPARLGTGVANLDLVTESREVVGGRKPTRAGADHEHPLAAGRRRRIEPPPPLERQVTE